MDGKRRVQVGSSEGRWFAWTDDGQVVWFDDRAEACNWAMLWSYRLRPAEAVIMGTTEVLSRY